LLVASLHLSGEKLHKHHRLGFASVNRHWRCPNEGSVAFLLSALQRLGSACAAAFGGVGVRKASITGPTPVAASKLLFCTAPCRTLAVVRRDKRFSRSYH